MKPTGTGNTTGEWHLARRYERIRCSDHPIQVSLRLKGKFRKHKAVLYDFNSQSASLLVPKALCTDKVAFLSLRWRNIVIDQLVCSINNCMQSDREAKWVPKLNLAYRCGVIFRPHSPLQLDRLETQQRLRALESQLGVAVGPDGICALSA